MGWWEDFTNSWISSSTLDIGLGVLIGGFSGYVRGRNRLGTLIDEWIIRGIEVLYGIPYLLIVILLLIVMKPGLFTIIIALALTGWIGMARLIRAQVLSLKQREFVIATERLGTSHMKIIYGHLIPNLTGIIIVNLSFTIPATIFQNHFKLYRTWGTITSGKLGTMTNDALGTLLSGEWWRLFFPAIMIALIMFAFNAIGDGLQDAIDPKIVKRNRKEKNMGQILSLENVTLAVEKENSKQAIVKHVSFSINEGEIVALVGESGSGKSVTAQSIIGLNQELIHIDDGNVSFQSKELTNLQESEWNQIRGKDISFIFQDPLSSLNPTMKVGKQITEVILQHGKKSKREAKGIAINLLTDLGIHEAEKRFEQYPHQLSGG